MGKEPSITDDEPDAGGGWGGVGVSKVAIRTYVRGDTAVV